MAKGFGSMIDDIKNRDVDDPTGMKSKKNKSEETQKKKRSGGFDGIIDSINDRDNDDPTGTKSKKKDKSEDKSEKKRGGGGIDGILDSIRDRDDNDPTGNKPKKKTVEKEESDEDEKTPLDGVAKTTTGLVSAGIGAMVGISVLKGMSGLMNMNK